MLSLTSCHSAGEYRRRADKVAYNIIEQTQQQALGKTEPFTIDDPAETLRRRLLLAQGLPYSSPASLGTTALEPTKHWPHDDYLDPDRPDRRIVTEPVVPEVAGTQPATTQPAATQPAPVVLTLDEALQVAARNSREYQTQKEQVFRAALALDLERNEFRNIFTGSVDGLVRTDQSPDDPITGAQSTTSLGITRQLKNGALISSRIIFDLARLLSPGNDSAFGLAVDGSIEIPLLRGAGRWVVTEPLTQAQRNTVYAIYDFERFKRVFAVRVATQYLGVLRQLDEVANAEENYRRVVTSARRAKPWPMKVACRSFRSTRRCRMNCVPATAGFLRRSRTPPSSINSNFCWACRRTRTYNSIGTLWRSLPSP